MSKVRVTILPEPILYKPVTGDQKKNWSKKLASTPPIELPFEDFAKWVGKERISFNHGAYKNEWICKDNFESSDIVVLDFDETLSLPELFTRCDYHNLPYPNIVYRSLSDPACCQIDLYSKWQLIQRYRAIWKLSRRITSPYEFDDLLRKGMYEVFPEADHVHAVQSWFGGKDLVYFDESTTLMPESVIMSLDIEDCNQRNIDTVDGFRKRVKKNREDSPVSFLKVNEPSGSQEASKKIRNFNWDRVREDFPLLDKLLSAEEKIKNPQLLGLYSGMRRIEGGRKKFITAIKNNPFINDSHLDIVKWFDAQVEKGKNPWELKICEYAPDDPASIYERLSDIHFKRGQKANVHSPIPEITLKEAEAKLQDTFQKFKADKSGELWVVKGVTALGKTEHIIKSLDQGCIAAFPTHQLKDEVAERLRQAGMDFNVTPELPRLPDSVYLEYDRIMRSKHPKRGAMFLKRMANFDDLDKYGLDLSEEMELRESLQTYFKQLDKCIKSDLPLITTHARYVHTDFPNHHTAYVDEDIIPTLFQVGKFKISDLWILIRELWRKDDDASQHDAEILRAIYDKLDNQNHELGMPVKLEKSYAHDIKNFEQLTSIVIRTIDKTEGQILPFLDCSYYLVELSDTNNPKSDKELHYIVRHRLPKKKTIILSATSSEEIFRLALGDIRFIDISNVEHVGQRYQFSDYSNSRTTIASKANMKNIQLIRKHLTGKPMITHSKFKYLFQDNDTGLHFGNCSGYDLYKGSDIVIVGTHHLPDTVYKLYAAELGMKFNIADTELKFQKVKYKERAFNFTTYEHAGLRNIQFYFIEGQILQAVGRNRSLRENVATYLFSNFPLAGFTQHFTNELPIVIFKDTVVILFNQELIENTGFDKSYGVMPVFQQYITQHAA